MYKLVFDSEAIKFLEKMPKSLSGIIFKKLEKTKKNPFLFFEKLTNQKEYKLRVGNYRVIADIDKKEIIIYVIYINHRKKVYKRYFS